MLAAAASQLPSSPLAPCAYGVSSFSSDSNFSYFNLSDKDNAAGVATAGALFASPTATVLAEPAPACDIHYHQPFSLSANNGAACVFRSDNIFRLSKWQHQLQLSTSGVSITATTTAWHDGTPLVSCRCSSFQLQRLASFVWYLKLTPASAEAPCLRQPTLQYQQHGGDINISSVHLFLRFSVSTAERQRHQHLRFSSTAVQTQRSATVTARAFAAASFSSALVCVFVSTSVEQQRTFQQQHESRSQLSDKRHEPRLHFSFGV